MVGPKVLVMWEWLQYARLGCGGLAEVNCALVQRATADDRCNILTRPCSLGVTPSATNFQLASFLDQADAAGLIGQTFLSPARDLGSCCPR